MRFASSRCGSLAHGFSGFVPLAAVFAGCGDDPKLTTQETPREPLLVLGGTHTVLRHGSDVTGFCAARSGARTALAELDAEGLRVRTAEGASLDEASLGSGHDVPGFDGVATCTMTPTPSGFAVAWIGIDAESAVRVQRLAGDGSPEGGLVTGGATTRQSVALAAAGDRIYVGRVVDGAEGGEVWVDVLDGEGVTSERIATCSQPTLPELVADGEAVAAFYACAGAEQSELYAWVLGDEEPVSLASAEAASGPNALAAAARDGDSWIVQWAPPGSVANALPPLFAVNRTTLEVSRHDNAERAGRPEGDVWFLDLVAEGARLYRQLASCAGADAPEPGCHVELCSLDVESSSEQCTLLEQSVPGALLPREAGATFTFLEASEDAGADLYSVVLDEAFAVAEGPVSTHAPGRFQPLAVDCSGSWCTVLGREGQSRLAGPDVHRYGFWTLEDAWSPGSPVEKSIVLEAGGPVVTSGVEASDWSAGMAHFGEAGLEVGSYRASGAAFRRTVADAFDPTALFFESSEERYRLFEYDATGVFVSRTVDAESAGPKVPVGVSTLEVVCGHGGSYTALDPQARVHYRIGEGGISAGEPLPAVREGSRELVSCLGESLFGLAFNGTGARVYRGTPGDQGALAFESFDFNDAAANGALGAGFGAVFGTLADERAVFYLQRAGGFVEPLVALVLGVEGEPALYALELPSDTVLHAAAAPRSGEPGALRLVWSALGSRDALVSSWPLP